MQQKWEQSATVRSRPRVVFDTEHTGYLFPLRNQLLSDHPDVKALGKDALTYLLVQSLYRYHHQIATIETRVVSHVIMDAVTDRLGISFTDEQKLNLYTILVDESYHAYVAYDAMQQIQQHTNIKPLPFPNSIEIEQAISLALSKLAHQYHGPFKFIAICLAENTLTKEMAQMTLQEETHPFFQHIIEDHFSDETRHSALFFQLLQHSWCLIDGDCKRSIAAVLPEFLKNYLNISVQMNFEKTILGALGVKSEYADKILSDTYSHFRITRHQPMLKNIFHKRYKQ